MNIIFNKIIDIKFNGDGCAISRASASMMTDYIKRKTLNEAKNIFQKFCLLLTVDNKVNNDCKLLGKLVVFSGVKKFPIRIKCATLSWHTMKSALNKNSNVEYD